LTKPTGTIPNFLAAFSRRRRARSRRGVVVEADLLEP
jgi:hypothetical protein